MLLWEGPVYNAKICVKFKCVFEKPIVIRQRSKFSMGYQSQMTFLGQMHRTRRVSEIPAKKVIKLMCENNFITQAAHQKKSLQFMRPPETGLWLCDSDLARTIKRRSCASFQPSKRVRGPCREDVSMGPDSTTHFFSFRYDCSIMLMNVYSLAVAVVHPRGT